MTEQDNDASVQEECCVVAIALPESEEVSSPNMDNGSNDTSNGASFLYPPGTQFISLEDASKYVVTTQNVYENELHMEATNETEETIRYIIQEEHNSDTQCFYAVSLADNVEEEAVEFQEESEVDDQNVPQSNYIVEEVSHHFSGDIQHLETEYVEETNHRFYEEQIDYLESVTVEGPDTDTFLYSSNGNVFVLREEDANSTNQNAFCDNVLQEYGYVFANEDEAVQTEECDEDERIDVETLGEIVSALKCVSCDFTTLDKGLLIQHHSQMHCPGFDSHKVMKKDKDDVVYMCGQCSIELPSIEACKQHMLLEHQSHVGSTVFETKQESIDNSIKGKTVGRSKMDSGHTTKVNEKTSMSPEVEKNLRDYWLQHGNAKNIKSRLCSDRKIRCIVRKCKYRFSTFEKMEKHRLCHSQSSSNEILASYSCSHCDEKFAKWPPLSLHLYKSHSIPLDIIECPLCKSHFTHSACMMAIHLQKHVEKEFDFKGEQTERWYTKKICQICQKTFVNSKILNKHIKVVHHKLKPFKCNVCGHSTSSKHMLQMHMRQHTGEKPFKCEYCSYSTGDQNTLRRHSRRHTKVHPYSCSLCPYTCIQSCALRNHIKSRHPHSITEKPKDNNKIQEKPGGPTDVK